LNVAPSLSNVAVTSPVFSNQTASLTGDMSDVGTQDTFTLVVDWGDGSPMGTFNYDAGTTAFNVSHSYQITGTHTIGLTLRDDDTGTTMTSTNITVRSQPAAAQFLSLAKLPNGHILLHLQGTPGATYRVETSSSLTTWQFLASQTADQNGFFDVEDTTTPLFPKLFYRAVWP
jgi:PKD domain